MSTARILLLVLLLVPTAATSQQTDSTRVRVGIAQGRKTTRIVGHLQEVRGDTVVVIQERDRNSLMIARGDIRSFERWAGMKSSRGSRTLRGTGIGAATGAGIGLIFVVAGENCSNDEGFNIDLSPGCHPTEWMLGLTGAGALVGAVVGSLSGGNPVDRWIRSEIPTAPAIVVRGDRLALRWAFRMPPGP